MRLHVVTPERRLQKWVQAFWVLEGHCPQDYCEPVLPEIGAEMIFHFGARVTRTDSEGRLRVEPEAMVCGQASVPYQITALGHAALLGVRFQPYALAAFSRTPGQDLTNQCLSVRDLFGSESASWHDQLAGQEDMASRLRCLERLLIEKMPHDMPRLPVRLSEVVARAQSVGEIARTLGLSERRLQQLFRSEIGISPGFALQMMRAQRALRQLRSPDSLAAIAADNGYTDQAHMTRAFQRFSGESPARLRARTLLMQEGFLKISPLYKT